MTDKEIIEKYVKLYTEEQGKFYYYSCGLLTLSIGYSFNLILTTTKPYVFIPISSLGLMVFSLLFGLYFIRTRFANMGIIAKLYEAKLSINTKTDVSDLIKKAIEEISDKQSIFAILHEYTFISSIILMVIWLLSLTVK